MHILAIPQSARPADLQPFDLGKAVQDNGTCADLRMYIATNFHNR